MAKGAVPSEPAAGRRRPAASSRVAPRRPCPRGGPRRSARSSSGPRRSRRRATRSRLVARPTRGTRAARRRRCRPSGGSRLPFRSAAAGRSCAPASRWSAARAPGRRRSSSPSCASSTASGHCTTCRPRFSALRRKMSPMLSPQTTTSSSPTSSATALSPAGLISRDEPMAKRSPATRNVSPACTRLRKSGIRWRNDPSFQRLSSSSRLSETQSAAGVIWSVSMASSFFPGRSGSQKISALPRMTRVDSVVASQWSRSPEGRSFSVTPGLRRAGSIRCLVAWVNGLTSADARLQPGRGQVARPSWQDRMPKTRDPFLRTRWRGDNHGWSIGGRNHEVGDRWVCCCSRLVSWVAHGPASRRCEMYAKVRLTADLAHLSDQRRKKC